MDLNNVDIDMNDVNFNLQDESGKEINCDILYFATDEIENKAYIAYTDYIKDETGKNRIVIAELINNEDRYTVIPIENQEIMEEIKKQVFNMINE